MGALQAILLADSLTTKLRPITLECVLPSTNTPMNMIDYTLAWLESAGVEEVFVLCCSSQDSKQIVNYLDKSKWINQPSFSVTAIESHNCTSVGDALRLIYKRNVIRGDFILVSGDIVTNMKLRQALEEHKERKQKDKNAIMTMVIKQSKANSQLGTTTDELIMAMDPTTKELLYYEDKAADDLKFDRSFLTVNPCFSLHNDKQDCYIDICSPQVLSLFTHNFDYQHLRGDFVKGLLDDDHHLTGGGFKIFTHEVHSSYYAEFPSNNNPTSKLESDTSTESDAAIIIESKSQIFEKKAKTIFLTAVDEYAQASRTFFDLRRLRLYYRISPGKCAAALFYLMLKLALDNYSNNSGKNDLVKETYDVILKWGGRLLRGFLQGVDDQIHVIFKLEEMCCLEEEYAPVFVQVLYVLYARNLIQQDAILKWANDKEQHATDADDESDNVFVVKQSEKFIRWLKDESSEEKYREFQETDLKRLDEGGVQVKKSRFVKTYC